MRYTLFFVIGFFLSTFYNAKSPQQLDPKDKFQDEVSKKVKAALDSVSSIADAKTSQVEQKTSTNIASMKKVMSDNAILSNRAISLEKENATLRRERDFYKSVAQNPVIIKKGVSLTDKEQEYYIPNPIRIDTIYLKKKWPFGKYIATTKN